MNTYSDKDKKRLFSKFPRLNSGKILSRLSAIINQKFTVMLIPHSERKIVNFQVNTLLIAFITVLLFGVFIGFFYMTTVYTGSKQVISEQQNDLIVTQGNINTIIDEVSDLVSVYNTFEDTMTEALQALDLTQDSDSVISAQGDLSSISDLHEVTSSEAREIHDIRRLRAALLEAIQPLDDISSVLHSEKQLLADLPTLWPVSGGRSVVTMEFGPNIHPIEGRWYLHKGIDIAGPYGLPILAAANGRVIESAYDQSSGYGNYILIEHKYGFKTRYSHMGSRLVRVGDIVSQGNRIGTLGNTGISSGAHLDFQIMLGTEVLDPTSFLSIKNNFSRWTGNR
ncbi:MAG: M23 family metallopeptidase [Salinispira sp.]